MKPKGKKLPVVEEQKSHEMDLSIDMMIQNATQVVTNRYEKEIKLFFCSSTKKK